MSWQDATTALARISAEKARIQFRRELAERAWSERRPGESMAAAVRRLEQATSAPMTGVCG